MAEGDSSLPAYCDEDPHKSPDVLCSNDTDAIATAPNADARQSRSVPQQAGAATVQGGAVDLQVQNMYNFTEDESTKLEYYMNFFTLEELHNILLNKYKCSEEFILLNCHTSEKAAQEIVLQERNNNDDRPIYDATNNNNNNKNNNKNTKINNKKNNKGNDYDLHYCCDWEFHFWCCHNMSYEKRERIKSRHSNDPSYNNYECCNFNTCCCGNCYFTKCRSIGDLFNFRCHMDICSCDDDDDNKSESSSGAGNYGAGLACGCAIGCVLFFGLLLTAIISDNEILLIEGLGLWIGVIIIGMIAGFIYRSAGGKSCDCCVDIINRVDCKTVKEFLSSDDSSDNDGCKVM